MIRKPSSFCYKMLLTIWTNVFFNVLFHNKVRAEGIEPTCDQLPFQQRIRQRGYTRISFFLFTNYISQKSKSYSSGMTKSFSMQFRYNFMFSSLIITDSIFLTSSSSLCSRNMTRLLNGEMIFLILSL